MNCFCLTCGQPHPIFKGKINLEADPIKAIARLEIFRDTLFSRLNQYQKSTGNQQDWKVKEFEGYIRTASEIIEEFQSCYPLHYPIWREAERRLAALLAKDDQLTEVLIRFPFLNKEWSNACYIDLSIF